MSNKRPAVKIFAAILTSKPQLFSGALKRLSKYLGAADHIGQWYPFTYTDFYTPEMGPGLSRCLVSFEKGFDPEDLPKIKKWTQKVEDKFRIKGRRQVNIDAAYMDFNKVVLASGKFGGHKVALTNACYADMIMDYQKGQWRPFPWCFPDFASGIYNQDLLNIRNLLKG